MQDTDKTYKFIGHILPDGHLALPDDLAEETGKAFEVTMRPVNDMQKKVSLYLQGKLEKKHRLTDLNLPAMKWRRISPGLSERPILMKSFVPPENNPWAAFMRCSSSLCHSSVGLP